jgi:hypothetical protein
MSLALYILNFGCNQKLSLFSWLCRLLKSHYYYSKHIGIYFAFIPLVFYETLLDQHTFFYEIDNDVKCSCNLRHPLTVIWIPKGGHCGLTIRLFLIRFQSDLSLWNCLWLRYYQTLKVRGLYLHCSSQITQEEILDFSTTQIYHVCSEMGQSSLIFNLYVD